MKTPGDMIPWAKPQFWGDEARLVQEALESTWISGGPFVDRLEEALRHYLGVAHALLVANGTAALHVAYLALGIGPGDEVVVPGFGFLAAANIALQVGAVPVFVEVDPETWCMDPADTEAHLTKRTRAIVAVHPYGNVCDMQALCAAAESRGIALIEDAAEAFGSRRGAPAGTSGTIGTFSFQATKTISTGEGGLVVTADAGLAEKMALYRSHGMRRQIHYWHEVPGHNFRLTNLQAALGYAQFLHLEEIVGQRRRIDQEYRRHLEGQEGLALQHFAPEVTPVVWAFALRLDPGIYAQGRDEVMRQMRAAGIETRPGFYPPSVQPLYAHVSLPVCEGISRQVISLPTHPSLSDDQIAYISETLLGMRR